MSFRVGVQGISDFQPEFSRDRQVLLKLGRHFIDDLEPLVCVEH